MEENMMMNEDIVVEETPAENVSVDVPSVNEDVSTTSESKGSDLVADALVGLAIVGAATVGKLAWDKAIKPGYKLGKKKLEERKKKKAEDKKETPNTEPETIDGTDDIRPVEDNKE